MQAEVTHSGIQIAWTPPQKTLAGPAPPVSVYRIYRAEAKSDAAASSNPPDASGAASSRLASPFLKIGETETPGYLDTQFEVGRSYFYAVRSVVQYGEDQIESEGSAPIVVLARDVSPPSTPRGLIVVYVPAQDGVPAHLELSWSIGAETDLAGYNVYRSDRAGLQGTRANIELLLTPAFRDMNALPDREYFYSVAAVDRSGNESPVSAAVSGAVRAESQPAP